MNSTEKRLLKLSLVKDATAKTADTNVTTKFQEYVTSYRNDNPFAPFTVTQPTDRPQTTHLYAQAIPKLRKWVGEKHANDFALKAFTIDSEPYEDTVGIEKWNLNNPAYQDFVAGQMARAIAEFPLDQTVSALETNAVHAFDNVAFFSTGHTLNPAATQSNVLTGVDCVNNAVGVISGALNQGAGLKDNNGDLLGIRYDTIFTNMRLYKPFYDAVNPSLAGATTAYQGMLKVIPIPTLTQANYVYFYDSRTPLVVNHELQAPGIQYLGEGSDVAFFRGQHVWSVEAHAKYMLTVWLNCLRVTSTT